MGINWYAPKAKQGAEVKVTKAGIVFTEAGMQKLQSIDPRFADCTHVRLGWDEGRGLVAVSPAPDGEKGYFKIGRRGRNQNSRTVNASKFFEAFGLTLESATGRDTLLSSEDGIALFRLNTPVEAIAPTRRRRGRAPKTTE